MPEAVVERGGEMAVAYTDVVPVLVESLKELQTKEERASAKLRAQIAASEARLKALEAQMAEALRRLER